MSHTLLNGSGSQSGCHWARARVRARAIQGWIQEFVKRGLYLLAKVMIPRMGLYISSPAHSESISNDGYRVIFHYCFTTLSYKSDKH